MNRMNYLEHWRIRKSSLKNWLSKEKWLPDGGSQAELQHDNNGDA
jgi:hypothetical protein